MQTPEVDDVDPSGLKSSSQQSTMQTPEVDDVDPSGLDSRPRSEKDTREKRLKKDTREKQREKDTREKQAEALSGQARAIYSAWCSLFTVEAPLTPAIAKAAQDLAQPVARWSEELHVTQAELLKRMMHWLYETDKTGYYKRGVKLYDLAREFEAWQSVTERELRKKSSRRPVPALQESPYSIAALIASQNPNYFAARNGE